MELYPIAIKTDSLHMSEDEFFRFLMISQGLNQMNKVREVNLWNRNADDADVYDEGGFSTSRKI